MISMPVGDHAAEAVEQPSVLGGLAVEQRDLLRILAHPHQIEAEVGLVALLVEIELRPAASRSKCVSAVPAMA